MAEVTRHPMTTGTMTEYDPQVVEAKWQRIWDERKLFQTADADPRPKFYALAMFPYPSGAAHVGHVRNYTLIDAVARFQTAKGFAVINPIGWDAFGLPAENAAIRTGIHPKISTFKHIDRMREQFKQVGFGFDWSREVFTCREDYYKWTQWLFVKMLGMKGRSGEPLVYRKSSKVHWCPKDLTVLANEQVHTQNRDGKTYQGCFRCGTPVESKQLEQWCFRITDYADELLEGMTQLEPTWPTSVISQQREWIGRSEGVLISFPTKLAGQEEKLTVFTTRADTVFGVTFLAIAPEHPLMDRIIEASPKGKKIREFVNRVCAQDAEARASVAVKEGLDTGLRALHPFTGEGVPVFVANYVLMYGTGAVMGVPAHDQRDFEFAASNQLPIAVVIQPTDESPASDEDAWHALAEGRAAFVSKGVLRDSANFTGLSSDRAIEQIAEKLSSHGMGGKTVNFRLRDWGLSRQRYWGCPIPVVHCPSCGIVPVPEDQLPVILPDDVEFMPTGKSPLDTHPAYLSCACPTCGRTDARRETDTMDTFVDSSWYYVRYCDPNNSGKLAEPSLVDRWMPVDQYIGGSEHAILHLIYARFICKVMRDLGITSVSEPFAKLFTQGMIQREAIRVKSEGFRFISSEELEEGRKLGKYPEDDLVREMRKMSKSQLNTVDPEYIVKKFGADTLRAMVMFVGPAVADAIWDDGAVAGVSKFLRRWWDTQASWLGRFEGAVEGKCSRTGASLRRMAQLFIHKAEASYSEDFAFNTVIAKSMELLNFIRDNDAELSATPADRFAVREALGIMAQCMAPTTPHIADELWAQLGHADSIMLAPWPVFRPELTVESEVEYPVQVGGKVRGRFSMPADASEDAVREAALSNADVLRFLEGKQIRKVIVVPGKMVNVVAN